MKRFCIALACGALLLAPGCGGDDEEVSETVTTPAPVLTVPEETTEETTSAPAPTRTTPPPPTSDPESGGSPAPSGGTEDTPQNDRPPAPGSPEERFEQFCEENPGACG